MKDVILDLEANAESRRFIINCRSDSYPNLEPENFEVVDGRHTWDYNCISNSVGIKNQWINPEDVGFVDDFDKFYDEHGYVPLDNLDFSLVAGFEKVVLFCNYFEEPIHAIKQEPDGSWSSKNGAEELIRCRSPYDLAGGSYGQPCRVYIRTKESV